VFDGLKIRNKLVALIAIPMVIIVFLAAAGAKARLDTASASREVEKLTALARSDSDVVDALQQESLYSTAFVGSDRKLWKNDMAAARKATDQVIVDALARQKALAGTSAAFRSASTLAAEAADKLTYIRSAVDQGYTWDQVAGAYVHLEDTFLEVNDSIAANLSDPSVAADLRTGASLASYKATLAQQGSVLMGASEKGGFADEPSFALLQTAITDENTQFEIVNSIADTEAKGAIRDALTSKPRQDLRNNSSTVAAGTFETPLAMESATVGTSTTAVLSDLHKVENGLYDRVIDRSKGIRSRAEKAANLFLLAALIAIVGAVSAAVFLGRRITRPLNHLTEAADRLSSEQMPRLVEWLRNPSEDDMAFELGSLQPIRVESKDEIGLLAKSFNDVQRVAGEVAAEQAQLLRKGIGEMFVNLARRNQALLDRQIDFIDELERGEEDPDQLENLYRLDHLATRMRRNAESLLVLAGAEPPRRRGRPAPLANVVRAAVAEVEDFARIDLLSFDEILVASNVAADLAHLLSELMENATNFSPPETRVEVVGHRTKADGYVISVTDHGIGMSNDQIAEANESLAKPPLVGLALSRSLGFIVVGRLASRHGVTVRMMSSPSGGVTAVVSIPPTLITDTPGAAGMEPPAPAAAEVPSRLAPVVEHADDSLAGAGAPPLAFAPDAFGDAPTIPPLTAERSTPEAEPTTGPRARPAAEAATETGLPARRMPSAATNLPPRRGGPAEPEAPQPAEAPAAKAGLPDALQFDKPLGGPAAPEAPAPAASEAPAAEADGAEADGADELAGRLDGPPPAAPTLATRNRGPKSTPRAAKPEAERTGFLEEAKPPRLFGRTDEAAPATPAPASTAPEPAPEAPAAAAPVEAPAEPAVTAPTPMPTRTRAPIPAAAAPAPVAEPVTTGAGLARRTPREGAGARAIPGADKERGVAATRRSPEEVRNLLSGFRAGQARARTQESSDGSTDDKDANE
jgi:signal transduction histidine kinase